MTPLLISILTFNIWGLPDIGFKVLSPLRVERVTAICKTLQIEYSKEKSWDVVLLQEVWVSKDREALKNCGYPYFADKDDSYLPLDSGLLILSKFPIQETVRMTYPTIPFTSEGIQTGEALANKSALFIRLSHSKAGDIWVGNTHLVAQYSKKKDTFYQHRKKEFEMYLDKAKSLANGLPLILGGDFNFGPNTPLWVEKMETLKKLSSAYESDNSCTICPPNTMHKNNEGKVDHLFGDNGLHAISGRTEMTSLLPIENIKINLSDHFGWETVFEIKNKL